MIGVRPKIWVSADWHLFHKNILQFTPESRPYASLEQMHEAFVAEWNSKVQPEDLVCILGDLSFGEKLATSRLLSSLRGRKMLVRGNHDSCIELHTPCVVSTCFTQVVDYYELTRDGVLVCMSHFPMEEWNKKHFGSIMLHGHCHGGSSKMPRRRDVGVDATGQLLINLEELVTELLTEPYDSVRNYHKQEKP